MPWKNLSSAPLPRNDEGKRSGPGVCLPVPEAYVTKDGSTVRELAHPLFVPGLGMSLAEAVVEAGGKTETHFHTSFDEIYYCLEGAGVLYVNSEPHPFFPGVCHLMTKGAAHSLTATTKLRLLCLCCPAYSHEETILLGSGD